MCESRTQDVVVEGAKQILHPIYLGALTSWKGEDTGVWAMMPCYCNIVLLYSWCQCWNQAPSLKLLLSCWLSTRSFLPKTLTILPTPSNEHFLRWGSLSLRMIWNKSLLARLDFLGHLNLNQDLKDFVPVYRFRPNWGLLLLSYST